MVGFNDRVKGWWDSFVREGRLDFVLDCKSFEGQT